MVEGSEKANDICPSSGTVFIEGLIVGCCCVKEEQTHAVMDLEDPS